ncbi:MAG: DUF4190 domain-containing protein [Verrucomicrobiota bacterium]
MEDNNQDPQSETAEESAPGLSVASLVLGIISIIGGALFIIPPILAIIFGHVSRGECRKRGIRAGRDLALVGLILGYVALVPIPMGLMAAMAIPAYQKVRETSQEKAIQNNLRQISSSAQQYFLETGEKSVQLEQLIGPQKYIMELPNVSGEAYPQTLRFEDTKIEAVLPDDSRIEVYF